MANEFACTVFSVSLFSRQVLRCFPATAKVVGTELHGMSGLADKIVYL